MDNVEKLYQNYVNYYRNNSWSFEDIKYYLKKNKIDYEEFKFKEFCDKLNTDKKFTERWGNLDNNDNTDNSRDTQSI